MKLFVKSFIVKTKTIKFVKCLQSRNDNQNTVLIERPVSDMSRSYCFDSPLTFTCNNGKDIKLERAVYGRWKGSYGLDIFITLFTVNRFGCLPKLQTDGFDHRFH